MWDELKAMTGSKGAMRVTAAGSGTGDAPYGMVFYCIEAERNGAEFSDLQGSIEGDIGGPHGYPALPPGGRLMGEIGVFTITAGEVIAYLKPITTPIG